MTKINYNTKIAKIFFTMINKQKKANSDFRLTNYQSRKFSNYSEFDDLDKKIKKNYENRVMKAIFNVQFISLIEQKKLYEIYLPFFKKITEKGGVPFDEYIGNWAKRLLKENAIDVLRK
jgi:hypothetical protein